MAAKGQNHFLIEKINDKKKPVTVCNSIPSSERVNEIARMLSGETITKEARLYDYEVIKWIILNQILKKIKLKKSGLI